MSARSDVRRDADLWAIEREFWLGGADVYESRVAPDALFVLPGRIGTLTRSQTIDVIRRSPRWEEVAFESVHTIRPRMEVALLSYEGIGQRDGSKTVYRARCASMYVDKGGRWMLIFHQQTPL